MALKDILVHVDGSKANAGRVAAAAELAKAHDAHLIGLYVRRSVIIPEYAGVHLTEELIEAQAAASREAAEAAETQFGELIDSVGISGDWRVAEGDEVEQLTLHGRYVDLVVIGQADPDEHPGRGNLTDRLVLSIGRAVLVIPYIGAGGPIGKRVLVAWDANRQAARAVQDSLPILEHADQVMVLAVNPSGGIGGHGEIPCADICLHLARHGVNAEAQSITAHDVDIGDMMLSRVSDESVDLLVMGAYGHARLRELVLGGVTRHILGHMTVPVLMSH